MSWDTVIGLEVHVQLNTKSKLFSNASTAFGAPANSQTSFIDAALPGVLPVLNYEAIHKAIQFGLAINARIQDLSYFERKNYFYPDLPKGYQISQYKIPIVANGALKISCANQNSKSVEIIRAHLEEDAGKSIHDLSPDATAIDLNRAGTPLLEVVTAPCLHSAEEAVTYLKELHQLVRFLGICDGNMQEGSFRCDVNLSLKPRGSKQLGTRTELKNLNSFRFIEKAIKYEQLRHQDLLESGEKIVQETRLYAPNSNTTVPMREKESEHDYRYFPDPDLLPIKIDKATIDNIQSQLPPLPQIIRSELTTENELNAQDIDFLLASPATYHYFSRLIKQTKASKKICINWLKSSYSAALNERGQDFDKPLVPLESMAKLLDYIAENRLSKQKAKKVFDSMLQTEDPIEKIIQSLGLNEKNDLNLEAVIEKIVANHPKQVADYKDGKEKLLAFFVGQAMKETKGQADAATVSQLLKDKLASI